jgi:CRISPR associated protein cas1
MSSLYVTEAGSFIKRQGGHVVVDRNNEELFEVPLERIEDITVFDTVSI